ncbi:MAG: hypothetical protein R6V85_07735 [Polyangia bacterium]
MTRKRAEPADPVPPFGEEEQEEEEEEATRLYRPASQSGGPVAPDATVVAQPNFKDARRRTTVEVVPPRGARRSGEVTAPWNAPRPSALRGLKTLAGRIAGIPRRTLALAVCAVVAAGLALLTLGRDPASADTGAGAIPSLETRPDAGTASTTAKSKTTNPELRAPRPQRPGAADAGLADAVDALAGGRLAEALAAYRSLARRDPQDRDLALAVRLLERRLRELER